MEWFLHALFGDAVCDQRRVSIFTCPQNRTLLCSAYSAAEAHARREMATQDVYFGLGLIGGNPSGRGTARDVVAIPGLWCDLDLVAEHRKGKALPATLEDVRALLSKLPCAPTFLVGSGHGVHAYWLFKEAWLFQSDDERSQAAALAKGWHRLICEHAGNMGWQVENLGDLARVLRLPGTINHKDPARKAEVAVLEERLDRRYNRSDFEPFLEVISEPPDAPAPISLTLTADAQPPTEKFATAWSESPLFQRTWNRQREDLKDQSQSAYDLSLATIAALREWTDPEIAGLIGAARRKHGLKPDKALRADYIERTIGSARKAANERRIQGVDLSEFMPRPFDLDGPIPLGELVKAYPGLRLPIIYGLLREGETMNVISSPKIGKSWLVNDLALAIAMGRPWLGMDTVQGDVLIIDNELHRETTAHRLPKVAAARGISMSAVGQKILVQNLRGRLQDLFKLGPYFSQFKPGRFKIVILDAFYRFLPKETDENDNGTMAHLYNCIDRFADQLQCAFVLIHHTSKGNQAAKDITDVGAGAGAQSRATDTHCVLRHHEEENAVVLDAAVRSWPPLPARALRWEFPLFRVDTSLDPSLLRREGGKGGAKKEKAEEAAHWTAQAFVETFCNSEPRSKARILEDAEQAGLSSRRAGRLIEMAEEENRIHRWSLGEHGLLGFATKEQSSDPSAPGPNLDKNVGKRAAIEQAIRDAPTLPAAALAAALKVSKRYVNQVRQRLAQGKIEVGTGGN